MSHEGRPPAALPRLLAVDDRPENLAAIAAIVEPLGVELTRAHSAEEALRAVLVHDFAVVLLDVQMPGTDGFQTARLIRSRQRNRSVPIIFVSAIDQDRRHDLAGYAAGAVDFLYKPVDADVLRAKIATFLELHRLRDSTRLAQQLVESERRGAAIVASALDCIVSIDGSGFITEFNPAAERTFGYLMSDVLGRSLAEVLVPPEYREAHRLGIARYAASGEARVSGKRLELPAMRADGSTFLSELTIVRTSTGGPVAFTAFLRDISDVRRAADRAHAMRAMNEALSSAVTLERVAAAIVEHGMVALGARAGAVYRLDDSADRLTLVGSAGFPPESLTGMTSLALDRELPLTQAATTGEAVFIDSPASWASQFPLSGPLRELPESDHWVALPLIADRRTLGAVGFSFIGGPNPERFDEPAKEFMATLAQQCALAFERSRLQAAEREARLQAEASRAHAEQARVQAELLAQEQAVVLSALPQIIAVVDREGRYVRTPGPNSLPGTVPARLGKLMAEVLPPSVASVAMHAVRMVVERGIPQDIEFSIESSGVRRWFIGKALPLERERVLCVAHDVTPLKHAEAERDARDRHHQAILAATNEVIWEVDLATGQWRWSDALAVAFGPDTPSEAGTTDGWLRRIHPDDAERVRQTVAAAVRGESAAWADEHRFRRTDGSYATVLVRGIVLRDAAGVGERMVGSLLDLSEREALESQLRQAQKMEALGQLAGGVAHDFNNLLTVITSHAAMSLEDMKADDPTCDAMREIALAADRAAGLTRQLLTFSRQNVRRTRVVSLDTCVAEHDGMLRRLIPESITIATSADPEICLVDVDPQQVGQILMNLAVNAGDAMPDGGTIRIETSHIDLDEAYCTRHTDARPGRHAVLTFSDSGSGMSAATLERIFEPFYTTKEHGKGTGLGLATVYGIVSQSNGHITVQSAAGQGTTFRIHLPAVDTATSPREEPPTAAPTAAPTGSEVILVVDDDAAVRNVVVRLLRRGGYTVHEAINGADAVSQLEAGLARPGLLMTDVVMPVMGAKALVPRVRILAPGTRVLLMSGYNNDRVDEADWAVGSDFLQKPFTGDQLLRRVRMILDRNVA